MNETTMTQTCLFMVIPDQNRLQAIKQALPEHYDVNDFDDIASLLSAVNEISPQLILCHQSLFEGEMDHQLSALAQQCEGSRVLIIGPPRPMAIQIEALKQGARGYFNQELALDKLDDAMQLIMNGEVWVERHVISGLIDELTHKPEISDAQRQALESLSPKETEVAKLVSHGATNKMIARQLNITERTVKAHLTTIFQKMNLPDRLSLAILFRDLR
jgi:DNA-binding NarL/FixJ family response regulator